MDTILSNYPEIIEMMKQEVTGGQEGSVLGRKDMPTVEQIVRAAIYKEIKNLTYRELESHFPHIKKPHFPTFSSASL